MNESSLSKSIWITVSSVLNSTVKLFRNNVGRLQDKRGTYVTYGLCTGSSDYVGWKTIEITRDMIGQHVAVFVALEIKRPGEKPTPEQLNFLNTVHRAGGIANVVHSVPEALDTLA